MQCHNPSPLQLDLRRGDDHLLLRREVVDGDDVYVGYVNGVEEVSEQDRGRAMRALLATRQPGPSS